MQWSNQQNELVVLSLSIYNKLCLFNTHVLMHDDLHSAGQHSTPVIIITMEGGA